MLCAHDFQGPTAYHDQILITQIFNDPRTLEAAVFVIEQNLTKDATVGIPEPFCSQPVQERTRITPREEVSNTPAHSLNQPAPDAAQHSSSFVSRFLSSIRCG